VEFFMIEQINLDLRNHQLALVGEQGDLLRRLSGWAEALVCEFKLKTGIPWPSDFRSAAFVFAHGL
jgi:hypothetical protein